MFIEMGLSKFFLVLCGTRGYKHFAPTARRSGAIRRTSRNVIAWGVAPGYYIPRLWRFELLLILFHLFTLP